jgi:hypothetical protein
MRSFRFRLAWLQLVLAAVAVLLWAERTVRLSREYRARAYHHAYMEATDGTRYCTMYFDFDDEHCTYTRNGGFDGLLSQDAEAVARILYYHRMHRK